MLTQQYMREHNGFIHNIAGSRIISVNSNFK